ncbi:DUF58 domain-containing protein [Natronobiforma cellulositropha]|uniref:DUF58 domain-containing protein n=1 Tax=Natronobiforma cellulositropha TaxID=1679076 RepID=UPI0021D57A4D|nr:DUF58 domain-containing protein [Natronobiforma cellulositropha]
MSYSVPSTARVLEPSRSQRRETETTIAVGDVRERRTRRWYGVTAVAFLALGLGLVTRAPTLVLASVFGLGFAAYARLAPAPPVTVSLERTLSDPTPAPGAVVHVDVTIRNESSRTIPDCRVVDGVPPGLAVVEGTPRHAAVLRPGDETTFTYAVEATRGTHRFDPLLFASYDVSGATERATAVDDETSLTAVEPLPDPSVSLPLRSQLTRHTGTVPSSAGGAGIEFAAVREYRRGDPFNRIDWNRTARTGELTTIEYRVERTASVVVLVDARAVAYAAPSADAVSAVDRSLETARALTAAALADGHRVGLAALSPHECWLAPGSGNDHRARLTTMLATHEAFAYAPPTDRFDPQVAINRLKSHLSGDTQVVLCSPLCDDFAVATAVRLEAGAHRVTVLSPDPTADDTPGHRLERLERRERVSDLRRRGIPVVDWDPSTTLERTLARATRGWSP